MLIYNYVWPQTQMLPIDLTQEGNMRSDSAFSAHGTHIRNTNHDHTSSIDDQNGNLSYSISKGIQ